MKTRVVPKKYERGLLSDSQSRRAVSVKAILDCYTPEEATIDLRDEAYESLRKELQERTEVYGESGKEFLKKLNSIEDWGV